MLKAGPDRETSPDEQTVRLARKRFARRQWARRWLALRGLVAGAILLGLVAGALWMLFFSSVLSVTTVRVDGNAVLSDRAVRHAAQVPLGDPLAGISLDAIAARVETLRPVQRVDVSRVWPHTVRIAIRERVAVAVVERGGTFKALDDEGMLFRDYGRPPAELPVVRSGSKVRADALAEAAHVVSSLPADLAAKVDFVEVRTIDAISLRLHDGRTVVWGSAEDSANKAAVLAVLLKQKATTYDVSVPGQPTIRR